MGWKNMIAELDKNDRVEAFIIYLFVLIYIWTT